jgi:acetyl-CoA decarbonylase/synthase complex subunit delta
MGKEVWKTKEAKQPESEAPTLGRAKERGIVMEIATATSLLAAGADILVLRHPDTAKQTRSLIDGLYGK